MRSLNWKSKLEEALERDKAKCDKININIRREDKITFTCNCGNTHNADVRRICQTTGAFCKICTKKISDNKRSETNMKKYGYKTNLQNISNESEIKRKEKLKDYFNKENNKDKICNNCGNTYNSSSPKSTTCRKCQQVKNVNKRKEKKYTEYFLEIYIVKEIINNFVLKFKPFTINLIFRNIVLDHNKILSNT